MGNVLSAQIPNQILGVEAYLSDINDVKYVGSLGSTRFMKVARVDHAEGPSVLKVFLLQDPSFSIDLYRDQVIQIRDLLGNAYNCCPFRRVYVTSRCVILSRPFQKYTLYDRISTYPFLTDIEKRWIAFHLFKALAQCEYAEVCHGDLKTQNVLVSSFNWVQITDFASFKPTNIPSDDPSYFTFFFDTSRRLSCYLAPERFCTSQELNLHPNLPGEFMDVSKGLTHAMDIFSLGCVLVELFTEGQCPFTYELLVKYKHASDAEAQLMIQQIQEQLPDELRSMIGLMLHRNPAKRPKASVLIRKYSPLLFPPIFDHFLYDYINAFRPKYLQTSVSLEETQTSESVDPDDMITKLSLDMQSTVGKLSEKAEINGKPFDQLPAVLLILALVTSNMRALKSLTIKFEAMKLLHRYVPWVDILTVADRILPYLVEMMFDCVVQVRCEAIYSVTSLLTSFKEIPRYETRLFIDYLFPRLKFVSLDPNCRVRITLAQNLGDLAEVSFRFIRERLKNLTDDLLDGSMITEMDRGEREKRFARQETRALQQTVVDIFVNLCDSNSIVKHSVVTPQSLVKLCHFFDRRKATDVLLSHLITFLNDKVDWRLRGSFFECCPVIAHFVGRHGTYILKALLQQGLHDYEEFVQLRTLHCICQLCEKDLLGKSAIYELLNDIVPFLAHPNEYLRMATLNILSTLDAKFTIADILCKVMPAVEPFVKEKLIKLRNKFVVSSSLKPHIPRQIWNYVVNASPVKSLLDYMADKQIYLALDNGSDSLFAVSRKYQPISVQLESYLKHLENLGLDHNMEDKLVRFEDTITKMVDFRTSLGAASINLNLGVIDLTETNVKLHVFDLSSDPKTACVKTISANGQYPTEWRNIYDDVSTFAPNFGGTSGSFLASDVRELSEYALSTSGFSHLGTDHNFAVRSSACKIMLSELLTHKRERYAKRQRLHPIIYSGSSSANSNSSLPLPSIRLGSNLVSHLHEHKAAITKLAQSPNGCYFASSGADGLVKLWSLNRIQGDLSMTVRADATFTYGGREINSVQFLGRTGSHLAIASEDCRISVIDAERMQLLTKISFDKEGEGPPVDIIAVDNLLYVLTHHSNIFCLDCRIPTYERAVLGCKPKVVWRHRIKNEYGLITSFCIDPVSQNWMCLTSTSRYIILWDLRFGVEVNSWPHPNDACRMLRCWPAYPTVNEHTSSSCAEIWTASSCAFELSRWKLETAQRTHVIWSSSKKPLQYSSKDKHVTAALAICPLTGRIFTGDSLGTIRSYNLSDPNECFYLSGSLRRTTEAVSSSLSEHFASIRYSKSVIDTVEVLSETITGRTAEPLYAVNPLEVQLTVCHKSPITDLLCCGEYLISSSRDGVIKVWK
ncbi:Protein kinase domain containing protein [Brugia malayi]|uniref:non-specific serine/threonine protein kinase n=1 Tax=Brugia malayi TaxID=6279 RepID=A0A4E9FAW1_BRUMA|nr:Protein kinase domain containing protein [Brugia malayi]VIO93356.1 Protein kinase domain containing protein [Brugia malayi]